MSAPPSTPRPRRRWLRLFVLLLVGAVVVTELALRIALDPAPLVEKADPVLGWRLRPDLVGLHPDGGHFRIDHDGWRGDGARPEKVPGTFRIGVLGDDMTSSFAVDQDETWCRRLEHDLPTMPGVTVPALEVLNFGVPDWSTAQELLAYRHEISKVQLDLLLLAFNPRDDVRDNSRALALHVDRPFFTLENGALALDDGFLQSERYLSRLSGGAARLRWWTDHSRIVQVGYRGFRSLWPEDAFTAQMDLDYAGKLLAAPITPEWTDAWNVTEALIEQMRREVEANGVRFAVVEMTIGELVHPDTGPRRALQNDLSLRGLDYPYERLGELGERTGITVIDLLPEVSDYALTNRAFLHGQAPANVGLYNGLGNRVVGQLLAHELLVHGLVPSTASARK